MATPRQARRWARLLMVVSLLTWVPWLGLLLGYLYLYRPWMQHWGATDAEASAHLPGDAYAPTPLVQTTRAITIRQSSARILPWLRQMGQDRGGFYSYDVLENLFGLDIHSADTLLAAAPLAVGDRLQFTTAPEPSLQVYALSPDTVIVFGITLDTAKAQPTAPTPANLYRTQRVIWSFCLRPIDSVHTRLLVRMRIAHPAPDGATWAFYALLLPEVHFLMEQKMMRGIRWRAEGRPAPAPLL